MKENVLKLLEFEQSHRLYLVYIRNGKYSRDARKFMSEQDDLADKVAMVAKTPYQTLIGNFFLGIYKPKMKIRLFSASDKAIEWLLQ